MDLDDTLAQIKLLAFNKYMEKFNRVSKIIYKLKLIFASIIVILAPPHFIWKQTWIGNTILILSGIFLLLFIVDSVITKTARKVFENEWNKTMNKEL